MIAEQVIKELKKAAEEKRATSDKWFFKTDPGEYGYGDKFRGTSSRNQKPIALKYYKTATLNDCGELLDSEWHDDRQTALRMLVYKYKKVKDDKIRKQIFALYIKKLKGINNWDLVDCSASYIAGAWLFNKERIILFDYARSSNLWKKRIAIIATGYFIRQKDFADTLKISEILLHDKHDLIHKAVGWMLREVGKRDRGEEEKFLKKYYKEMPRTMLRYAIEKFPESLRQAYLKGKILR